MAIVRLRPTTDADLDFVVNAESDPDTSPFIIPWPRHRHAMALGDVDVAHRIAEDEARSPVGFVIVGGLTNPDSSIECDAPCAQILLIPEILVRRDEDIEARGLGSFDERAVLEVVPLALERCFNGVSPERPPQRSRRSLIKQDFQGSGWDSQTLARVLQYRIDLRARNARKPLEEIHDRGTAFEILEEGADGNAGASEQPFTTDLSGDALNSGTQAPLEHTEVYSEAVPRGTRCTHSERGTCMASDRTPNLLAELSSREEILGRHVGLSFLSIR